jgi:hypothetical protein
MDDLSYRIFTQKSEADKAINSLKGILAGIQIDRNISKEEVNELNSWAKVNYMIINRKPLDELLLGIVDLTNNPDVAGDAIEDLKWLCQKYEPDNIYYGALTAELQTLQGVLHGVMADGILSDEEIMNLHKWVERNSHMATYYPFDEIRSLLLSVVSDGIIEEEERLVLMAFFNQFITIHDEPTLIRILEQIKDIKIDGHCTSEPIIDFEGKTFCVTGIISRGSRKQLYDQISLLGGIIAPGVSKTLDYLIVGDHGNPAFAFACYGRKVEKAIGLRKEGHRIQLIHEYDMLDAIEDLL